MLGVRWLGILFALVAGDSLADFSGRVVAVHDGDTLLVRRGWEEISVRLDEIDAPELAQPYGPEAQRALSGLCLGRGAEVREHGPDKYDRVLGRVVCAGTDANAEQVRRGAAWFYAQYSKDEALRDLETEARSRRLGLWARARSRPVPPWEFRHADDHGGSGGRSHGGNPSASRPAAGSCGVRKTCGQMASCEEAQAYLARCGDKRVDRDGDGVPCESLCQ